MPAPITTPITDAADLYDYQTAVDTCRQLERDLAAMTAERDDRQRTVEARDVHIATLQGQLAACKREIDAIVDAATSKLAAKDAEIERAQRDKELSVKACGEAILELRRYVEERDAWLEDSTFEVTRFDAVRDELPSHADDVPAAVRALRIRAERAEAEIATKDASAKYNARRAVP